MHLFPKKRIYLDYASAPPVSREALRAMREAEKLVGNPGAIHAEGVAAKRVLSDARERIAKLLEVKSREIVFTSGLTEANNLAIIGAARALERVKRTLAGTEWLVSAIEHSSVLECFAEVERMGGTVHFLQPDARGLVTPERVAGALTPATVFVSVGWGNNEIGTIQPLGKISQIIRGFEKTHKSDLWERHILLHSDAGQAPLYLPTTAHSLGLDLLSLGGNKLYGPHGIGVLYMSNRAALARTLAGGPQERGLRPGTESVALAAGFAAAYEAVARARDSETKRLAALRDEFAKRLEATIPGLVVNGSTSLTASGMAHILPHMLNVSIPNINSEYVALALDHAGIAISTKSACREGEEQESHAIAALAVASEASAKEARESWRARNTLRFSLGRGTTAADLKRAAATLAMLVNTLT
jgi:cysteine desulfurase